MNYFKKMIKILKIIENNNYYLVSYREDYLRLFDKGYILVKDNGLIQVTDKFIKKYHEKLVSLGYTKYQIQAFSESPLHPVYFKNEMIAQYLNNPNYHFRWNHYRGNIVGIESGIDKSYLKNICLAYDLLRREPIIMMFLGDVLNLDIDHQNYIKRFQITDINHLKPNKEVVNNLIYGNFSKYEDSDIYNLLIEGMKIVNNIFSKIYNLTLFREVKESKEYEHFHPIFISSKINYYLFVLELYKMIYDNINRRTLKMVIIKNNPSLQNDINDREKWPIWNIFKASLGKLNYEYLKSLSKIRNEPAHEIYNNELDSKYWKKQDELLIETYKFINTIIVDYSPTPLTGELTKYKEVFGPSGSISIWNGFNQTPYIFYNGQTRLVCERLQQKDAEYLVAFKSLDNFLDTFVSHVMSKRPDLDEESIRLVATKMFEEAHKPDKTMVESFFKGNFYIKSFYNHKEYNIDKHIELGEKLASKFLKKYSIENIFVFADSTDPYFYDLKDCVDEAKLTGKGYITEIIHFFKEEYQYDNVITDPNKNLKIQVLSNIWD